MHRGNRERDRGVRENAIRKSFFAGCFPVPHRAGSSRCNTCRYVRLTLTTPTTLSTGTTPSTLATVATQSFRR